MRNLLFALLLTSGLGINSVYAQNRLNADDEKAIAKVVEDEGQYFVDGKLDAWAACWVHDSLTFWSSSYPDRRFYHAGWDSFYQWIAPLILKNKPSGKPQPKDKYIIHQYGTGALVRFVQDDAQQTAYQTRVLEKRPDGWKIIFHQALHVPKTSTK